MSSKGKITIRRDELEQIVAKRASELIEEIRTKNNAGEATLSALNETERRETESTTVLDTSHFRQIEQELWRSEERLRVALEAARMGIWEWNILADKREWNDEHFRMLDYEPGEVVPSYSAFIARVLPEDLPDEVARFKKSLDTGCEYVSEYRVRHKDGSIRWIEGRGRPLFDKQGNPLFFCGVMIDITNRKETEEVLQAAIAKSDSANLAKSKFLAAASHDLRQPVQSLALLLSVMDKHVIKRPRSVKTINMMKTVVNNLSGLLNGILDISRLDANTVVPLKESIDVSELIDKLAREYVTVATNKKITLRLVLQPVRASTDHILLERALRNLIENALRYTNKGGVLIGVRPRGDRVRIDIFDTGIGIHEDFQTKVFEEFYQVGNEAKESQGMGLGLSIVARIARLLDIDVQVSSRLGRGSRFSLILPLDQHGGGVAADWQQVSMDLGGRLLIIEDDAVLREGLVIVVELWGYEALAAANGEEALKLASNENWKFDVIMTDFRLGDGLTGLAVIREIERRSGQTFPTIIITGDVTADQDAEIQEGKYLVLHKPARAEDIRNKIAQILETKAPSAISSTTQIG